VATIKNQWWQTADTHSWWDASGSADEAGDSHRTFADGNAPQLRKIILSELTSEQPIKLDWNFTHQFSIHK